MAAAGRFIYSGCSSRKQYRRTGGDAVGGDVGAALGFGQGKCRIVIPASPPGVYPAVEFQDGDLRTKSSMVTQRCRDLVRFGLR